MTLDTPHEEETDLPDEAPQGETSDQEYSPKDFCEPLLRVLGDLSEYTAFAAVPHTSVYTPVFAIVGVAEDAYGYARGTEIFQTRRWVQFAFMTLKKDGLCISPKKGNWALTKAGVKEADRIRRKFSKVAEEPPRSETRSTIASYYDDPYICSLAARATPCFGHFSDHHRTDKCPTCPIQRACRKQLFDNLVAIAETFREGPRLPAGSGAQLPAGAGAPAKPPPRPRKWDNQGAQRITNHVATDCSRCGEIMEKGATVYWQYIPVEDTLSTAPDALNLATNVLFHLGCLHYGETPPEGGAP